MSTIRDSRFIEYRGFRFRTVGKGIEHCQACLRITYNYVGHVAWHETGVGDVGLPAVSPLEPRPLTADALTDADQVDVRNPRHGTLRDIPTSASGPATTPALARATETLIDRSDAYDPDEVVARKVVSAALHDPDDPAWLPVVIAAVIRDFHSDPTIPHFARHVADAVRAAILGARGDEADDREQL